MEGQEINVLLPLTREEAQELLARLLLSHDDDNDLSASLMKRLAVLIDFMTYAISRRAHDIETGAQFRLPEEQFIANVVDMSVGALLAAAGDTGVRSTSVR